MPELERHAVDDHGVAGVRPALVAADEVRVLREQVDDLALAFVAPLRADDDGRGHERDSARWWSCSSGSARPAGSRPTRSIRISWPRGHVTALCARSRASRPSTWAA